MTGDTVRDLLEFATEVAWRAGRATLSLFQTGVRAEIKADATPVTDADRAAERIARDLIERRFPRDGIIGEELGAVRLDAKRRWIIDPIDGTHSFVHGVPLYGVLLAIEEGEDMLVGVAHFPALRETVAAARGEGCWWDGRRARVSATARIEDALIVTTDAEAIDARGRTDGWNLLRGRAGICRTWGDGYGYALVATGRADAMLDPVLSLWDAAAMAPIIEEAGGVLTDWGGAHSWRNESLIATNAALAADVRALLAGST